jgi:hypothetical protein
MFRVCNACAVSPLSDVKKTSIFGGKEGVNMTDAFADVGKTVKNGVLKSWTSILPIVLLLCVSASGGKVEAANLNDLNNEITVLQSTVSILSSDLSTAFARLNLNRGPVLVGGVTTASAGTTVNWPVTLVPSTFSVSGIQFDLVLPSSFSVVSVSAGPTATAAGKSVTTSVVNGQERVLIFGLNQNVIAPGVVALVKLSVAPLTPPRICPIAFINPGASDPAGNGLLFSSESGTVEVQ